MKAIYSKILAYILMMLILVGNTGLSFTTVLCACHGKKVYALIQPKEECCKHNIENVVAHQAHLFQIEEEAHYHSLEKGLLSLNGKKECCSHFHGEKPEKKIDHSIHIDAKKCCDQDIQYIHLDKGQEFKYSSLISCECENHHHTDFPTPSLAFLAWDYTPIYYAPEHPIWQIAPLDYNYLSQAPPLEFKENIGRFIINQVQNYRC